MEEQPVGRVPISRNHTVINRCITFENEIERVELRREQLVEELLRNKRYLKQNSKFYISKKKIIPSTFQHSSCHQPSTIKIFNAILHKRRNHIYSEHSDAHKLSNHVSNEKQDRIVTNRVIDQEKQIEKWRLQINSEELNSLFFGKQLKIGERYRQKYISDEKIKQMKKNMIRSKSRENTIHQSREQIERGKFKEVDYIKKKNAPQSQSHLLGNLLNINSIKKSRKYHPLRNLLRNEQSEPIRDTRKNTRYSQGELA